MRLRRRQTTHKTGWPRRARPLPQVASELSRDARFASRDLTNVPEEKHPMVPNPDRDQDASEPAMEPGNVADRVREVTVILDAIDGGDRQAARALLPMV